MIKEHIQGRIQDFPKVTGRGGSGWHLGVVKSMGHQNVST